MGKKVFCIGHKIYNKKGKLLGEAISKADADGYIRFKLDESHQSYTKPYIVKEESFGYFFPKVEKTIILEPWNINLKKIHKDKAFHLDEIEENLDLN